MLLEVFGPPAVSLSVVPFACVIVTLVMATGVPEFNVLTKSFPCGELAMSKAVIAMVAGPLPWVCTINVDALVAVFVPPLYEMLSASFASVGERPFGAPARKFGSGLLT